MTDRDILSTLDNLFVLQGCGIQPDPETLARRVGVSVDVIGAVLTHLGRRNLVDDRARLTMQGLAAAAMLRSRAKKAGLRAA